MKARVQENRALVVLAYRGPQRTIDLAEELEVSSSTATRMMDRLVRRGLATRTAHPEDGRATQLEVSERGRELVAAITSHRRNEFLGIVRQMKADDQVALRRALEALQGANGAPAEPVWPLGWDPHAHHPM